MDRLRDADTTLVVPNPFDIPPPGSIHDKPGFFVDCDLEAGFLGTPFRAYWANMITECIRNAILKAGLVPEYTDWTQLGLAIEKIAITVVKNLIPQPTLQSGGNVTGEIRVLDGIFTLNAPEAPEIPDVLVQEGGNVTGTISIADGTFTLTADDTGGGGGEGPAIPDKIVAIGSGTSIRPAQDGAKSAGWDNGEFGVSGVISCGNGYIRSSVYDGQPLGNAGNGLFLATLSGDGDAGAYFFKGATNSTPANVGGVRKFAVDTLGAIFASTASIGAADYAEWFETVDGQPLAPGLSVVLVAGKVRPATEADCPGDIIGVTRPGDTRLALIGNAAEAHWAGLYLTDAFGAPIWTEAVGADGTVSRTQALNPAYDPDRPYLPRSQRPDWVLVGLLGQVPVQSGQPLGDRWRVMRRASAAVDLVYIR